MWLNLSLYPLEFLSLSGLGSHKNWKKLVSFDASVLAGCGQACGPLGQFKMKLFRHGARAWLMGSTPILAEDFAILAAGHKFFQVSFNNGRDLF